MPGQGERVQVEPWWENSRPSAIRVGVDKSSPGCLDGWCPGARGKYMEERPRACTCAQGGRAPSLPARLAEPGGDEKLATWWVNISESRFRFSQQKCDFRSCN